MHVMFGDAVLIGIATLLAASLPSPLSLWGVLMRYQRKVDTAVTKLFGSCFGDSLSPPAERGFSDETGSP